jgi:selenocysteine lyase/cysteine desulfurase
MTRAHSDDFPQLVHYTDEYRPGARRFDVGETSNFALVPAVAAALRQALEWGVGGIYDYAGALTDRLASGVAGIGLSLVPAGLRARHLVGVYLAGTPADTVARAMEKAGVYVSVRGDAVRVAPHVYNDTDDIDRLVEVLRTTI